MKKIIGILIAIAGIALGIYVGVWLMFIGGIVQIVNSIKSCKWIRNSFMKSKNNILRSRRTYCMVRHSNRFSNRIKRLN